MSLNARIAVGLIAMLIASPAHAETLNLVCGEGDSYFGGSLWTYTIDVAAQTVTRPNANGMVSFPARVNEQTIEWDENPTSYRIDRFTGLITQFGAPWGTISRKCRAATQRQF
jgi:hypothetical protein